MVGRLRASQRARWEERARNVELKFTIADAKIAREIRKQVLGAEKSIQKIPNVQQPSEIGVLINNAGLKIQSAKHLALELGNSMHNILSLDKNLLKLDRQLERAKEFKDDKIIGKTDLLITQEIDDFQKLADDCTHRLMTVGSFSTLGLDTSARVFGISKRKAAHLSSPKANEAAIQAFKDTKAQLADSKRIMHLIKTLEKYELR